MNAQYTYKTLIAYPLIFSFQLYVCLRGKVDMQK